MMTITLKDGRQIKHVKRVHFYLYNGEMPDELAFITQDALVCDCVDIKDVANITQEE